MKEIKNVIIYGLGGLGTICAAQISKCPTTVLKIVVDKNRYERYTKEPTIFNEEEFFFDYTLQSETDFKADLAIIATKSNGLNDAVKGIENFVDDNTIFLSLLNGIYSEDVIAEKYGWENTLISFYLGHSCERESRKVSQDGVYKLVIGTNNIIQNDTALMRVKNLFDKAKIKYEISENIQDEYWKKFIINVGINQLSAATGLTLIEIKKDAQLIEKLKGLMHEAELIAQKQGIKNHKEIYQAAEDFLLKEMKDAKTSMLQDVKAGRKTEVDIFAGTVINLGEKHNVETPLNKEIYKTIKDIENKIKFL